MNNSDPPTGPYVGLIPYLEKDAPLFFGRELEQEIISANLIASRLTVLYGPTGVGKTSVLRAGVSNHLRNLSRPKVVTAVSSIPRIASNATQSIRSKSPEFVVVLFNRWRDDPICGLVKKTQKRAEEAFESQSFSDEGHNRNLSSLLKTWTLQSECEFLIILDQFEDYFLYHGREDGEGTFAVEFPRAVNTHDLHVNFLISIREDALARLDRFKGRIPSLFDNYFRIDHLNREAARDAIEKPIKKFNESYDPGRIPIELEPALVDRVLEQLEGQTTLGQVGLGVVGRTSESLETRIEAYYLQLVMTRLWDEELAAKSRVLRLSTLERLGGTEKIWTTDLDKVMEKLGRHERKVAMRTFLYLVTPTGLKVAHTSSDLAAFTHQSTKRLQPVLADLCSPGIRVLREISSVDQPEVVRYEIFHDVLVPAIMKWRQRYELLRELRKYWITFGSFLGVLLLILLALIYYVNQKRVVTSAKATAEKERSEASRTLELLDQRERATPFYKSIMRGHTGAVLNSAFSVDGKKLLTASEDGTARIWDADTGTTQFEMTCGRARLTCAAFSRDSSVITGCEDGSTQLWKPTPEGPYIQTPLSQPRGQVGRVNSVAFSPDGQLVVTANDDGSALVYDSATGSVVSDLRGHAGVVTSAVFSTNGSLVATTSLDGTARVWESRTGQTTAEMRGHLAGVYAAVFSHNGKLVATASADSTARVWVAATGKSIAILRGHSGRVNTVAFSQDDRLVTSSVDGTARVWDLNKNYRASAIMNGHTDRVLTAVFSPNGERVVTASEDKTARVWESSTGRSLAELRGHTSRVNSACFSPDSSLVATGSGDGTPSGDTTARVWNTGQAVGFRVEAVLLRADPAEYVGPCPATIRFVGRITALSGSGTVRYKFVRNNEVATEERSLTFDSPGSKEVTTAWKMGGPSYPRLKGSFHIQILYPEEIKSEEVTFEINCESCELGAPEQLSPPNGMMFPALQREVTLQWSAVASANGYKVEMQLYSTQNRKWATLSVISTGSATSYQYHFKDGAQGRWRVWALDEVGRDCKPTSWMEVRFAR